MSERLNEVSTPSTAATHAILSYKSQILLHSLVADRFEAGRRPAAIWNLAYVTASELARASRSATSLGPVCDQNSVMEFGFEPVCDQVRAGSSYLDMIRRLQAYSQNTHFLVISHTCQRAEIWPTI